MAAEVEAEKADLAKRLAAKQAETSSQPPAIAAAVVAAANTAAAHLELDEATVTFREIRAVFRKLGLEPRFVGAIPSELRPKIKTQLLSP